MKVAYTCKNCGWKTSILVQWSDLKPKRCMNKKCNVSFLKNPEELIIQMPTAEAEVTVKEETKKQKKNPKLTLE